MAAEPLVASPVAIDFAADGSLWVCEMYDYPTGIDRQGKPGGRVKRLVDVNGDGKMDSWFKLGSSGQLEVIDRPSAVDDGWDVAREILAEQVRLKNRWALRIEEAFMGSGYKLAAVAGAILGAAALLGRTHPR